MRATHTTPAFFTGSATATFVLAVSVCASTAALEIRHDADSIYTTNLTRAYEECVFPDDTSSDGVPACSPPLTSACDFASGTLTLEMRSVSPTTPVLRVRAEVSDVSGPGTCTTDDYSLLLQLSMTIDDAACATGQCTMVEFPLSMDLDLSGNDADAEFFVEDVLGLIGVTVGQVVSYEVLGATVDGPDGLPLAAAGVGDHGASSFRSSASVAYPGCDIPDTASTDGVPACSGPTWGATCDFTVGEIELTDVGDALLSVPNVGATFANTSGASPSCADGAYEVATVLRLTGSVCSGLPCTLVDTQAVVPLDAANGNLEDAASLATSGLAGPFDSIEVRETLVRDPLGAALASPALTNAFLIDKPKVVVKLIDPMNPSDDRIVIKGRTKVPTQHPPIDPTVGGATFTVTDQNGIIYTVTIPSGVWETTTGWRYLDDTGSLAGVYKASIKAYSGASGSGFKLSLKAKDTTISSADLPTANLVFSASNSGSGTSIAERNMACTVSTQGSKCKL